MKFLLNGDIVFDQRGGLPDRSRRMVKEGIHKKTIFQPTPTVLNYDQNETERLLTHPLYISAETMEHMCACVNV